MHVYSNDANCKSNVLAAQNDKMEEIDFAEECYTAEEES